MGRGEDENDFLGGMGGFQSMGILNALRTGNPTMDMALAMSLPLIIRLLVQLFSELQEYFKRYWLCDHTKSHERIIELASTRDQYGRVNSQEEDSQNTILMKAIRLYLHKVLQLDLREAELDLTTTEDKNASVGSRNHYYYEEDDDDEDDDKTVFGAVQIQHCQETQTESMVRPGRIWQARTRTSQTNGGTQRGRQGRENQCAHAHYPSTAVAIGVGRGGR